MLNKYHHKHYKNYLHFKSTHRNIHLDTITHEVLNQRDMMCNLLSFNHKYSNQNHNFNKYYHYLSNNQLDKMLNINYLKDINQHHKKYSDPKQFHIPSSYHHNLRMYYKSLQIFHFRSYQHRYRHPKLNYFHKKYNMYQNYTLNNLRRRHHKLKFLYFRNNNQDSLYHKLSLVKHNFLNYKQYM